jgi:hypothetical protein
VDQLRANVGFEAVELQDEVLGVQAHCLGGTVHAWVVEHLLESLQALPSAPLAFNCLADDLGKAGVGQVGDDVAAWSRLAPADAVFRAVAAHCFAAQAKLCGDVIGGAKQFPGLLFKPGGIDLGGFADGRVGADAGHLGVAGDDFAGEAGLGGDHGQSLAGLKMFAFKECAVEHAGGALANTPGGNAAVFRVPEVLAV